MNQRIGRLIAVSLLAILVACAQQPVPTAVPTPVPPTATSAPTATPTQTPIPEPTQNIPRTVAENPLDQAYIRIIHAATGVDSVDVYMEDLRFAGNVSYG